MPQELGRELGDRARTRSPAYAIRADAADLVIDTEDEEIRARQVIVAAQAPHAAPLVAPVAEAAAGALRQLSYGAFLSVAIETSETTAMPYDDVYAIATPGRVFDMLTNQAHALHGVGPRRPGGSLMLFAGAHGATALMHEPDETIVARFLADLRELFPQTRGVVANARVQRWPLGNVYAVADAIDIPIMYYNLPSASGVTLTADQFRALPVTCLKDTGGDATAAMELIQTDGPTLLNGWDTFTFAALAAGVRAVVWGVASIVPEQCVELHRLLIDDIDLPAARELWARLWPLCQFLESESYPAAVKAACRLAGDNTGPVRAPLLPLDDGATSELAPLLARASATPAAL